MTTTVLFVAPLIYRTNQKFIDAQLENISQIVGKQTEQVKSIASQHAATVAQSTKHLVGDYSAKAQEMIGNARGRSVSPTLSKATPAKTETSTYKNEDFPPAPKEEINPTPVVDEKEPLIAS
jgi:hypothetical protein